MSSELFQTTFGTAPARSGFTPGRVNLIGEHIDYLGGTVLPVALPVGIRISLTPRRDSTVRVASVGFSGIAERDLSERKTGHWSDYALGAAVGARSGADIALTSTLPHGAGLSSSAALVVGLLTLLLPELAPLEVARRAQAVEHDFLGVPCGIMDQVAVAVGRPTEDGRGEAVRLDTRDLSTQTLPLLPGHRLAVLHSGHRRELSEGRYAERRAECEAAARALGVTHLAHATREAAESLSEPLRSRTLHAVTEQHRVEAATDALRNEDAATLGHLLLDGHASLRDCFDCTVPATDALVETATLHGALGARQTGGGWGGAVVALVEDARYSEWLAATLRAQPEAWSVL